MAAVEEKEPWDRSIEEMRKEVVLRGKDGGLKGKYQPFSMNDCGCKSGFQRSGPHIERSLPLKVYLKQHPMKEIVADCLQLSINLVNDVLARNILEYTKTKPPTNKKGPGVVTLHIKTNTPYHGATSMSHDRDGRANLPREGIWMHLRSKENKSQDQQRKEYVSTLTHELLHALGIAHIITSKKEIMSAGRGGTCICEKCPVVAKNLRWKQSPRTLDALRWLYDEDAVLLAEKYGGMPTICNQCFILGWKWY